jgi:hypothetical protein
VKNENTAKIKTKKINKTQEKTKLIKNIQGHHFFERIP